MHLSDLLLLIIGLLGHVALWTSLTNRLHGYVVSRKSIWAGRLGIYVCNAGIPVLWWFAFQRYPDLFFVPSFTGSSLAALAYWIVCLLFFVRTLAAWWAHQSPLGRAMPQLESNHTEIVSLDRGQPLTRSTKAAILSHVPWNEIFEFAVHVKTLRLRRLPAALDGLTITHLSDLHISKHMETAFYEQVLARASQFQSDLILITGDLIDGAPQMDLTVKLLSQLQAAHGVYYIFGNHEIRMSTADIEVLEERLEDARLIRLGGRWRQIEVNEESVILAGNSLPWHGTLPPMDRCLSGDSQNETPPFRILMSHSPDQIEWARAHQFDLMLAGHTHGGQVRFPIVGPVVCPSRYGGRYAAGLFDLPPTLLHVCRGISGMTPYRFRCHPELTQLVLRCPPPRHVVKS